LFKTRLNARAIDYHRGKPEDLDVDAALQYIVDAIRGDDSPILIGSSLGGFLGARVALECSIVRKLVLLNPAIIPPRADVDRLRGIPKRILLQMRDDLLFNRQIVAETTILMATEDEVIPPDWILDFARAQEATVRFLHDDHGFSNSLTRLPRIISEILH
jgi:predicted esterase YcpF (UPF0227 family)